MIGSGLADGRIGNVGTFATSTMGLSLCCGEAANSLTQATTVLPRRVLGPNIVYRVGRQRAVSGGRQQWQ